MKKTLILAATALLLASCNGNARKKAEKTAAETRSEVPDMHTAETSLDYRGTYIGTFPAADCPGIKMRLTLKPDGVYELHMKYIDRDTEFDEKGAYQVEGNLLTMTPAEGGQVEYYKVEENRLRRLDADKQPVTGALAENYVLQKTDE